MVINISEEHAASIFRVAVPMRITNGLAITQVVKFNPRPVHVGSVVNKVAMGRFSLSTSVSPANSYPTSGPFLIIVVRGYYNRPFTAQVQSDSVSLQVKNKEYKITVFWDVAPRTLGGSYKRFGGTCCLHLQISGDYEYYCLMIVTPFSIICSYQRYSETSVTTSTRLHGVTSQKTIIFIVIFVRTSSVTWDDVPEVFIQL
jgi:hypothetical protein